MHVKGDVTTFVVLQVVHFTPDEYSQPCAAPLPTVVFSILLILRRQEQPPREASIIIVYDQAYLNTLAERVHREL